VGKLFMVALTTRFNPAFAFQPFDDFFAVHGYILYAFIHKLYAF
jgi:hypothetical protein